MRCFSSSDTSRHKHRSIFLDIQQITDRTILVDLSPDGKHPCIISYRYINIE